MAYESWSQVVIRTVIEWEKRKAELECASAVPEQKPKATARRKSKVKSKK